MSEFHESDVQLLLATSPDHHLRLMSRDTAMIKSLTRVFNASLEFAKDGGPKNGAALATALGKKALAVSGVGEKASGSTGLKLGNFIATQTLRTMGLTRLAGMTPSRAGVQLTFVAAEKIVSAAGLAGVDKCGVAVASLAATTGMGAMTCFASGAFTLGVGCVVGAIAIAADAFDVYGQCYLPSGTAH